MSFSLDKNEHKQKTTRYFTLLYFIVTSFYNGVSETKIYFLLKRNS